MIAVTLLHFSGRENYSWVYIHDPDIKYIIDLLRANRGGCNSGATRSRLGFAGFRVVIDPEHLRASDPVPAQVYVCDGLAPSLEQSKEIGLELIAGFYQDARLKYSVRQEIWGLSQARPVSAGADLYPSRIVKRSVPMFPLGQRDVPDSKIYEDRSHLSTVPIDVALFNKLYWNNNSDVRESNNCYAYGCNYLTSSFPQPGRGSGRKYATNTLDSVRDAIGRDGLKPVDKYSAADRAPPNFLIALVLTEDSSEIWDYHFYRLVRKTPGGAFNSWAHKPGRSMVRRRDEQGKVIYDPLKCARGRYTLFGGFFVGRRGVRIK